MSRKGSKWAKTAMKVTMTAEPDRYYYEPAATDPLLPDSPEDHVGARMRRLTHDSAHENPFNALVSVSTAHAASNWLRLADSGAYNEDQKVPWSQRLAFMLDTSRWGRIWDLADALLNVLFAGVYVWNTTYTRPKKGLPFVNSLVDFLLAAVLLLQWLPRILLQRDKVAYLLSLFPMLTIISVVPVLLAFVSRSAWEDTYMSAGLLCFLFPCRFQRMHLSLMRCVVPRKNIIFRFSIITQKAMNLGLSIFNTLLTVSAVVHIVEVAYQHLVGISFADAFYFIFVSSTSGLSTQIIPDSTFSRFVVVYVMVVGAFYIPTALAELLALMQKRSKYRHSYKPKGHENHIIICGTFDATTLSGFLKEFFSPDHGLITVSMKVILLCPYEPSEDVRLLLADPLYWDRVQYIKGTCISFHSLQKAKAKSARACFVLTSRFTDGDTNTADAKTVMRAVAIRKFSRDIPLFVQVCLPANKIHLECIANYTVCLDEIKMGILASNALAPGFAVLVYLLTTSITEQTRRELCANVKRERDRAWIWKYIQGATEEIYPCTLGPSFRGLTFMEAAEFIYLRCDAVLLAILVEEMDEDDNFTSATVLAPADYTIKGKETVYVIATDIRAARRLARIGANSEDEDDGGIEMWLTEIRDNERREYELEALVSAMDKGTAATSTSITPRAESPVLFANAKSSAEFSTIAFPSKGKSRDDKEIAPLSFDASQLDAKVEDTKGTSLATQRTDGLSSFSAGTNTLSGETCGDGASAWKPPPTMLPPNHRPMLPPDKFGALEGFSGHFLICDTSPTFPQSLAYFLFPLRKVSLPAAEGGASFSSAANRLSPRVVILCPAEPDEYTWSRLQAFGRVSFVRGNPMVRKDLLRAGVDKASRIVILTNTGTVCHEERTADAQSLLVVLNAEATAARPDVPITVEFIHMDNIKFVDDSPSFLARDVIGQDVMRPAFMCGKIYPQSLPWNILCQTYYNKQMLDILKLLIFSGDTVDVFGHYGVRGPRTGHQAIPASASGPSFPTEPSNANFKAAGRGLHRASGSNTSLSSSAPHTARGGRVYQIPVPERIVGRPFCELLSFLTRKHGAVPFALYRTAEPDYDERSNRPLEGQLPHYVLIHPETDLVLNHLDRVFVIGPESVVDIEAQGLPERFRCKGSPQTTAHANI